MIHAYLSKSCYQNEMLYELEAPQLIDERLVLSPHLSQPVFALDIWPGCEILNFTSINDAIKQLKARSLRWAYYGSIHFRRGALIAAGLKLIKQKELIFGAQSFPACGIFTLLNENELLSCQQPWKKWPLGEIQFAENKQIPPNRAYLKLWEALTVLNVYPKPGELCLDLGASPGGWSWVLASCGAKVIAIDKAPLDPKIAAYPTIRFQAGSAFALDPQDFDAVDWLCSDIICYPKRSLALIEKWLHRGQVRHIICTIKLQGETDWDTIQALKAIPHARLVHLFHNKHELTFLLSSSPKCDIKHGFISTKMKIPQPSANLS